MRKSAGAGAAAPAVTAGSTAKYAVKVFRRTVGTPGSAEYEAYNTPQCLAWISRAIGIELMVLETVRGYSCFVQIRAIGELHIPSSSSSSSQRRKQQVEQQPLICAVLERLTPLETVQLPIPGSKVSFLAGNLVVAVELMHSGRLEYDGQTYIVVHRDLAPKNLLFGRNSVRPESLGLCVADFEAAALMPMGHSSSEKLMGTAVGTPLYMAPEVAELYQLAKESAARRHDLGPPDDSDMEPLMRTAVGTPKYMAPEVAALFEAVKGAAAAAAGCSDPGVLAAQDTACGLYRKEVDVWSIGGTVMTLFGGGGLVRLRKGWKVPAGTTTYGPEHMHIIVEGFVKGDVLVGPIIAMADG